MATVTPQMVKQLRDRTDQPMGLCKQALDQSGADMEAAILWLQKQNKNMTAKREGNEVAEGRVGVFVDNAANVAGIVEMRCESAPSAKSDQFVALANDLAKHVAAANPADVVTANGQPLAGGSGSVQERIDGVVGVIREKMVLHKLQRLSGNVYGGYVHHDGTVGVVFEAKGTANDELLKDVATHIAALNPPYATVADVPADVMAREKDLVAAEIAADPKMAGKPAQIMEKISADKLTKRLADIVNVLTEQQMANEGKYPKTTVGAALKKAGLEPVRFVRYKVGAVALQSYTENSFIHGIRPMPHTASAWKRLRKNEKRRIQNRVAAKKVRLARKAAVAAIGGTDTAAVATTLSATQAVVDRAADKGYIHKNKAARIKSRLAKKAKAAAAKPGAPAK